MIKAKIEGFSQALLQLKLEEIRIATTTPIDTAKLATVRAQETAINEELQILTIGPLKTELEEALIAKEQWNEAATTAMKMMNFTVWALEIRRTLQESG